MLKLFIPNQVAAAVEEIRLSDSCENLFFDFDNTLMRWNSETISPERLTFLRELEKKYRVIIATNGGADRLRQISDQFEVLTELQKPLTRKLSAFMRSENLDPGKSAFIGDNLITDIFTANKLGMHTIKVDPIHNKEFLLTKLYRVIEVFIYLVKRKTFKLLREEKEKPQGAQRTQRRN